MESWELEYNCGEEYSKTIEYRKVGIDGSELEKPAVIELESPRRCQMSVGDGNYQVGEHEGRYQRCVNCRGRIWD